MLLRSISTSQELLSSLPDLSMLSYTEPTQTTDTFNRTDDNFNTEVLIKTSKKTQLS